MGACGIDYVQVLMLTQAFSIPLMPPGPLVNPDQGQCFETQ